MSDDLFERARAAASCVDLAARKGSKMVARKGVARGVCPINGCGANSGMAPFQVRPAKRGPGDRFICWSCCQTGTVIDLEHALFGTGGESVLDAARRLAGDEVRQESAADRERREAARARAALAETQSAAWKAALARSLWREGVSAVGTPVETYLRYRRISGWMLDAMLGQLRFHPRAWHSGHPQFGAFAPAMIGLVVTEFGPTGGVHATYLRADGRGKASRAPAKRMIGPQGCRAFVRHGTDGRMAVRAEAFEGAVEITLPGGIWLTRPDAEGPLVVAEGIENAASRAVLKAGALHAPVRALAAGSLDRLAGYEAEDDDGCRDVRKIVGNVLRPPVTWPESPDAPWGEVEIATDGDMSPVRVRGRAGRRKVPTMFRRDAAERARVGGVLAAQGWRRRLPVGSETRVWASRPPLGLDFNDVLRARAGASATAAGVVADEGACA